MKKEPDPVDGDDDWDLGKKGDNKKCGKGKGGGGGGGNIRAKWEEPRGPLPTPRSR